MGFFSWNTSDTNKSISNRHSIKGALPVYLLCPDGTKIYEPNYEGHGKFGGNDVYALVAKWNMPNKCTGNSEEDTFLGVGISCYDESNATLKYPIKFVENGDLNYEDVKASTVCEYQGYFYDDYEEEEEY